MPNLVVTCHPDGRVETLLKDKVLDTRILGETRKIERVSEILPTDDGQKFFIRWLKGPLSGSAPKFLNGARHVSINEGTTFYSKDGIHCHDDGLTCYFNTYEEAVAEEVFCVNNMRLVGVSFV